MLSYIYEVHLPPCGVATTQCCSKFQHDLPYSLSDPTYNFIGDLLLLGTKDNLLSPYMETSISTLVTLLLTLGK